MLLVYVTGVTATLKLPTPVAVARREVAQADRVEAHVLTWGTAQSAAEADRQQTFAVAEAQGRIALAIRLVLASVGRDRHVLGHDLEAGWGQAQAVVAARREVAQSDGVVTHVLTRIAAEGTREAGRQQPFAVGVGQYRIGAAVDL